jgi:hypothetical protein
MGSILETVRHIQEQKSRPNRSTYNKSLYHDHDSVVTVVMVVAVVVGSPVVLVVVVVSMEEMTVLVDAIDSIVVDLETTFVEVLRTVEVLVTVLVVGET